MDRDHGSKLEIFGGVPSSDSQGDYRQDGGMKPPPPPPPPSPALKAEAFASALLQEEAEKKKKPFSRSPLAYVIAIAAGTIVAPTGPIVSPIVLFLSNLKGEYTNKAGQKITPLISWIGAGVVLTPLCWMANLILFPGPPPPTSSGTATNKKETDSTESEDPFAGMKYVCEEIIKRNLREPRSYERIGYTFWGSQTSGSPKKGVSIQYRSRNGFGGMSIETAGCLTETGRLEDLALTGVTQ